MQDQTHFIKAKIIFHKLKYSVLTSHGNRSQEIMKNDPNH